MALTEKEIREVRAFSMIWWFVNGFTVGGFLSLVVWSCTAQWCGENFVAAVGISAAGMGLGLFLMIAGVCAVVTKDRMEN